MTEALTPLAFGTDGIRGPVGPVISQETLARIVAGLVQYLQSPGALADCPHGATPLTIVTGGDSRSTSDYFAHLAAVIASACGARVLKATGYVTTPMLAHAVVEFQAHAGFMITASHNPADHNGLKWIAWHGGPAMPEQTEAARPWLNAPPPDLGALSPGTIEPCNPAEGYAQTLLKLVDFPAIKAAQLAICYDALYGAGKGYFRQLMLSQDIPAQILHGEDDPWMGKAAPDPTEARLEELAATVVRRGFAIGLATDGDGDRFAAVDHSGCYVPPARCLAVIAHYLYTRQGAQGDLIRSVATSHLLDRIAAHHGFTCQVTPVGFKFLADRLRHDPGCLMAGEENGGFALRGHLPNKDGLLGCFLLLEALAMTGQSLQSLEAEVAAVYGAWTLRRLDWALDPAAQEALLAWIASQDTLELAGEQYVRSATDRHEFMAADGSWVLIRPSGTEELLRVYCESPDPNRVPALVTALEALRPGA